MFKTASKTTTFKTERRGKFQRLVLGNGDDITIRLYGCFVKRVNGQFVTLALHAIDSERSDFDALRAAAAEITRLARPEFEPLCGSTLITKLTTTGGGGLGSTKWENEDGDPALPWDLAVGREVDVVVSPGIFGDFGSCWLIKRIKPKKDLINGKYP